VNSLRRPLTRFVSLSSYTHSGMTKIGRRFDGDGDLRSSFKPEAKHDALKATITLLTVFAGEFFDK
jgi:hypothetical protein